jgi:hypothetical protein
MKLDLKFAFSLLLISVLLTVVIAGCAQQKSVTQSGKPTCRVAIFGDATAIYAADIGPQLNAYLDFGKWANANNYVPGMALDFQVYDHGADNSRAISAFKEAVSGSPKPVMVNDGYASTFALLYKPLMEQNKIPGYGTSALRSTCLPVSWYFAVLPSPENLIGAYTDWIVENWKKDSKIDWIKANWHEGAPRMAFIAWDSPLGRAAESPEVFAYMKSKGVEFAGAEYFPLAASDPTPQLSRIKGKFDFAFVPMFPPHYAMILQGADRLGMAGKYMAAVPNYFDPYALIAKTGKLADNTLCFNLFEMDFSKVPSFIQTAQTDRQYPKEMFVYRGGWIIGDLFAQTIKKTIDTYGIDKVTGENVYATIRSGAVKDIKAMGCTETFTFSNNDKLVKVLGLNSMNVGMIKDSKWSLIEANRYMPRLFPGDPDVPK